MKSKNSMEAKNKMEGGDTMDNNCKYTKEQLDELIQKGKSKNGVLTYKDIMSFMQGVETINPEDVEYLYEIITR